MKRKLTATFAALTMLGVLAAASPASAKPEDRPIPGRSYCSGSSAPDGIVDPVDFTTWNNPGEIISFLAPDQQPGGGPDALGAVAGFCNPNAGFPIPG